MNNDLSVVTIAFNNVDELKITCASVDKQLQHPHEHLIIDGSANMEIVHWLEQNSQPSYRRWIHERDNGISDAFNKGIQHASGNIIHLLNSGDTYYTNDAIAMNKNCFEKDKELMWTHSLYVQHRGGIDVITGAPFSKDLLWKGMRTVAHPTMFVRKELYEQYGLFNTDYTIAMDYDFLIRIRNEKFLFIEKPLIYFSPGGASNNQFYKGLAEVKRSYHHYIGNSIKLNLWQTRQIILARFMTTGLGKLMFKLKNKNKVGHKSE